MTRPRELALASLRAHGHRSDRLHEHDHLPGRVVLLEEHLGVAPVCILGAGLEGDKEERDPRVIVGGHLALPDFLDLEVRELAHLLAGAFPGLVALAAEAVDEVAPVDGADVERAIGQGTGAVELHGLSADRGEVAHVDPLLDEAEELEAQPHIDPEGGLVRVDDEGLLPGTDAELAHDVIAPHGVVVGEQSRIVEAGDLTDGQGQLGRTGKLHLTEPETWLAGLGGWGSGDLGGGAPELGDGAGNARGDVGRAADLLEAHLLCHGLDPGAHGDQRSDDGGDVELLVLGHGVVDGLEEVLDFGLLVQHDYSFPYSLTREGSGGGWSPFYRGGKPQVQFPPALCGKELAHRQYRSVGCSSRVCG
ncbi:MAG: hypothetical protein UX57_C0018G0016 [Candidatus Uhrbacteria bacterium GW2011_GWE2_46_68]|uniref:Uncharacterized protein n=2 Tax=Candidatus Uhriibacteriota TaxID=1752732 RepID=A0A0G1Q6A8_9BACT|nr:MAG: hypothetical protein UX45_C0026G0003 [Candidatus Uhrbacteria bacterium GW2011_GWF2_46_218]KKU40377.1 MAG: hypothetical protein UX57_C0018G0016 [Candidatus Uhrbacteria bacterium GW2011_GWE2_46_68]